MKGGSENMVDNALALKWDDGKYNFQHKLGNFVQNFQVNLPTNSFGVPLQLVDPVPLTECLLDAETTDDIPDEILRKSILPVEYDEGIPTLDGLPIWERFDGETLDYYKLFKEYREMAYLNGGSRSIAKLSGQTTIAGRHLSALSKVYHWQLRCKAYDAYKKVVRERKRQFEIEKLESKHMRASEILLEKGLEYIEDHPEQLSPKIALSMIETAMKAGRLSLGLNADKPGSNASSSNININQTVETPKEEKTVSVGDTKKDKEETVTKLESLIHILSKSGAFDQAKQEIIDGEFSEVEEPELS